MQEENLRRNLPSPAPDHLVEMEAICVRDLNRTDSYYSSDITAEDCSAPGASTMWTDEKHSLYLASLEASLVNHLNNPVALRGCLREILWSRPSYRAIPTKSSASARQDGKRQKTIPQRNKLLLESTADSHTIPENPYVHRFTSSVKRSITECHDQEHNLASSERLHDARENSPLCSVRDTQEHSIEVSDQNFVDVGLGERSNCKARVKRLKRVVADDSSSDQVVPCRDPSMNYASTSRRMSSIREEQSSQELQLENLDKCPKPEV